MNEPDLTEYPNCYKGFTFLTKVHTLNGESRRTFRFKGSRKRVPNKKWSVFRRDDFTCQICGTKAVKVVLTQTQDGKFPILHICDNGYFLTLDHIVPKSVSKCGTMDNLQTACQRCNVMKDNKLPENYETSPLP